MDTLVCTVFACGAVIAAAIGTLDSFLSARRIRRLERGVLHCGFCLYNVRSVGSWRCPECGEDLRQVGIRTRENEPPVALWARIALWTTLMAAITTVLVAVLMGVIPGGYSSFRVVSLKDPHGSTEITARVFGIGRGWDEHPSLSTVDISISDPAGCFETKHGGYHAEDDVAIDDVKQRSEADWQDILAEANIGEDATARDQYASDIHAVMLSYRTNMPSADMNLQRMSLDYNYGKSRRAVSRLALPLGLVLGGMLWFVGLRAIIRGWSVTRVRLCQEYTQLLHRFAEANGLSTDGFDRVAEAPTKQSPRVRMRGV